MSRLRARLAVELRQFTKLGAPTQFDLTFVLFAQRCGLGGGGAAAALKRLAG